jgi:Protein of unknown function (DUF3040)/Chloramphenicol phosphotransferase-like protein
MSLPRRQQLILDQIEQALQAADPRLRSMFAAFGRSVKAQAAPAAEVIISDQPSRRTLVIFMMVVVCMLGVLVVGIRSTSNDCPGLSSDQVIASAAVRYAGCSHSTAVWNRGGR